VPGAAHRCPDGPERPLGDSPLTTKAAFGVDRIYQESVSMQSAIKAGKSVGTVTSYGAIRRGDVVVFHPPDSGLAPGSSPQPTTVFLNRVIGLPGETVSVAGNTVRINGAPLDEPYLAPGTVNDDFGPVTVSMASFFVLGDTRQNSDGSRMFGPIASSSIVAVGTTILAPAGHKGSIAGSPR